MLLFSFHYRVEGRVGSIGKVVYIFKRGVGGGGGGEKKPPKAPKKRIYENRHRASQKAIEGKAPVVRERIKTRLAIMR